MKDIDYEVPVWLVMILASIMYWRALLASGLWTLLYCSYA